MSSLEFIPHEDDWHSALKKTRKEAGEDWDNAIEIKIAVRRMAWHDWGLEVILTKMENSDE